jgi:hypothetical protein
MMVFQSEMRRARQAAGIAGCRPTLGKDLRGTFPVRTSGILCREQGQEIGWPASRGAAFRSSRRGPPRFGRDWMMLREQQSEL